MRAGGGMTRAHSWRGPSNTIGWIHHRNPQERGVTATPKWALLLGAAVQHATWMVICSRRQVHFKSAQETDKAISSRLTIMAGGFPKGVQRDVDSRGPNGMRMQLKGKEILERRGTLMQVLGPLMGQGRSSLVAMPGAGTLRQSIPSAPASVM
jgi:hypothetical protein